MTWIRHSAFSRASGRLRVFTLSFHWLVAIFARFVWLAVTTTLILVLRNSGPVHTDLDKFENQSVRLLLFRLPKLCFDRSPKKEKAFRNRSLQWRNLRMLARWCSVGVVWTAGNGAFQLCHTQSAFDHCVCMLYPLPFDRGSVLFSILSRLSSLVPWSSHLPHWIPIWPSRGLGCGSRDEPWDFWKQCGNNNVDEKHSVRKLIWIRVG